MLSYLAAALPPDTSAAARLLAVQCALRMSADLHVRLPRGVLRSLHIHTLCPWHELERARWLRPATENSTSRVTAALLDGTLLEQAPARPDRLQAADWALRVSSEAGKSGPLAQLAGLYLAAHADPALRSGQSEIDHMAHLCGTQPADMPRTLARLAAVGLLGSWQACARSGDVQWTLARGITGEN